MKISWCQGQSSTEAFLKLQLPEGEWEGPNHGVGEPWLNETLILYAETQACLALTHACAEFLRM